MPKKHWTWADMKLGRGIVVQIYSETRTFQIAHQIENNTWVALIEADIEDHYVWWISYEDLRDDGSILDASGHPTMVKLLRTQKLTEKQLLQAERNVKEYNKKEVKKLLNKVFLTKQDRDRILANLSRSKKDA